MKKACALAPGNEMYKKKVEKYQTLLAQTPVGLKIVIIPEDETKV